MSELDHLTDDLNRIISQCSLDDFTEGIPYIQAREICDTYEEYQYCCQSIDDEGIKRGVDPQTISELHSTFERYYFKYTVHKERLGSSSRRFFVAPHNAAPGKLVPFRMTKQEEPIYIEPADYKIEGGAIYRLDMLGNWNVVSNTVFRPVSINYDIEQQKETIKIMYRWHNMNHTFDCSPSEINNLNYIKKLVDRGIDIVIDQADDVRDFLNSTIRMNRGASIPEIRTTNHLGWTDIDGHPDFVPFSNLLVYSGEHSSQSFTDTFIRSSGTLGEWIDAINQFRDTDHIHARIILAASFASVLVKPLGVLPFAVDVWGGGSGSGKSVSLMTATSVWAKPGLDDGYIKKCDSTMRSLEFDTAILNNLPLCIDETQTVADRRKFDTLIYNLCSGESHGAMGRGGKKQTEKHWANSIILTGEQPIATNNSLAGATNRVIDIECPNVLFWDDVTRFSTYCKALRNNYGTAGRKFIDYLCMRNGFEHAKELFEGYLNALQNSATGKQATSAAIILTADSLIAEWIFNDDLRLTIDNITPFLKDEKAVDTNERAHQLILEWIATNSGKFEDGKDTQWGRYGTRNGRKTCEIVKKPFSEFLAKNGFSDRSYLSWARNSGKIYYKEDDPNHRNDVQERFHGERVRFVCIYIDET